MQPAPLRAALRLGRRLPASPPALSRSGHRLPGPLGGCDAGSPEPAARRKSPDGGRGEGGRLTVEEVLVRRKAVGLGHHHDGRTWFRGQSVLFQRRRLPCRRSTRADSETDDIEDYRSTRGNIVANIQYLPLTPGHTSQGANVPERSVSPPCRPSVLLRHQSAAALLRTHPQDRTPLVPPPVCCGPRSPRAHPAPAANRYSSCQRQTARVAQRRPAGWHAHSQHGPLSPLCCIRCDV